MAIVSEVERNCEDAWISALTGHVDLMAIAGMAVVRGDDCSSDPTYPCVIVTAHDSWTPPEFHNIGVDRTNVELQAMTYKHDDDDRSICDSVCGAVRDLFRDDAIKATLSGAVVNFTVKGIEESEPAMLVPDDTFHIRKMTALITAIATD